MDTPDKRLAAIDDILRAHKFDTDDDGILASVRVIVEDRKLLCEERDRLTVENERLRGAEVEAKVLREEISYLRNLVEAQRRGLQDAVSDLARANLQRGESLAKADALRRNEASAKSEFLRLKSWRRQAIVRRRDGSSAQITFVSRADGFWEVDGGFEFADGDRIVAYGMPHFDMVRVLGLVAAYIAPSNPLTYGRFLEILSEITGIPITYRGAYPLLFNVRACTHKDDPPELAPRYDCEVAARTLREEIGEPGRCTFVAPEGTLGWGNRCILPKHEGDVHQYGEPGFDMTQCSCTSVEVECDPQPGCETCKGTGMDGDDRCVCALRDDDRDPDPNCPQCEGTGERPWGL